MILAVMIAAFLISGCAQPSDSSGEKTGSYLFGQKPGGAEQGGRAQLAVPSDAVIATLARNYQSVIKACNEGPSRYTENGPFMVISDDTLSKMKETGFNTVQLLVIGGQESTGFVADEESKILLLNDIVKIKQGGMAVWVAFEYINAPPGSGKKLSDYAKFKTDYFSFIREFGAILEKYKVEYVTVNNEPDLFFQEQTQWGTETQIFSYVAEFMPLANKAVKETFRGKIINKVTQVQKRPQNVIDASFADVDIASIDVGPPAGIGMEDYRKEFVGEYNSYAKEAQKKGMPWMVGEYWAHNFKEQPSDYVKQNQLTLAKASFDAYLATTPKGIGYTWNDFTAFSFVPNGEATRLAIREFFSKF